MVTRKSLCTVAFAAIGSVLWVSPILAQPVPMLELAIADTARVVDYENGIYVVGTSDGDLYVINEAGEYTVTAFGAGLNSAGVLSIVTERGIRRYAWTQQCSTVIGGATCLSGGHNELIPVPRSLVPTALIARNSAPAP